VSESITVLCEGKPPTDLIVSGIGKLGISEHCKGFGRSAHFQTHSILNVDTTGYDSNFLSTVDLDYDCCEYLKAKTNLSGLHLNTSFKHIVSHLEDLKLASHKISDVEKLISEHEWCSLHLASHSTYSALVYVCLIAIALYVLFKLYTCVKPKVPCSKAISDTNRSGNVVNIKIHTSNESLALAQEEVPLWDLNPPTPEVKPRRSHRVRSPKTCF
jgi:hypothetical protein